MTAAGKKSKATQIGVTVEEFDRRTAAGERWCWYHVAWHPVAEFGTDRSRVDGMAALCRKGNAERCRIHAATGLGVRAYDKALAGRSA